MYISLYLFCFDVTLTMLFVAVFYVTTSVGGCGWTIFVLMDIVFWKFSNHPPNCAYMSDDMEFLIMMYSTCTGPFYGGISCIGVLDFDPRKISTSSALCLWL